MFPVVGEVQRGRYPIQTESPEAFVRWIKKHPVWAMMLFLFSISGFVVHWFSGKILDSWFGSAPPFTISINIHPALNTLGYVYPLVSAAFLCALFIALVQIASDRARGPLPGTEDSRLSLDIVLTGEIVIARASSFEFSLTGKGLFGDYLIATGVRLTNRDVQKPVALTITLCAKTLDRERAYRRTDTSVGDLIGQPDGLRFVLLEQPHSDPVTLAAAGANRGRLVFRVPGVLTAAQIEDLSACPMEWEIEDSISERKARYPVTRTRTKWRMLK
jgi:hypothetical protein